LLLQGKVFPLFFFTKYVILSFNILQRALNSMCVTDHKGMLSVLKSNIKCMCIINNRLFHFDGHIPQLFLLGTPHLNRQRKRNHNMCILDGDVIVYMSKIIAFLCIIR
jgi:hypothetical protein